MTATLTPTGVYRTWFPAVVQLPDGRRILKAKVYATDVGLLVYGLGPGPSPVAVFESPMLLDKTGVPGTDYASEQRGHTIVTEAGTVSVVRGGSCPCAMRALKTWSPPWAAIEKTWGA